MSRSGYSDDCEQWSLIRWRGAVTSAIRGKRGQAFLRELLAAIEALPEKRLIAGELVQEGEVCALGALGQRRGMDMTGINVEDSYAVADAFLIPRALACEIEYINDDDIAYWRHDTPEQRYERVHTWLTTQIANSVVK